jgi:hypothetical protein
MGQDFPARPIPEELRVVPLVDRQEGSPSAVVEFCIIRRLSLVGQYRAPDGNTGEPHRPWRIITSDEHSTVWDGETTLFEFNFQAFGIPADECFAIATKADANLTEMKPGEERKVGYPEHYSVEQNRRLELVPANDIGPPIAVAA